MTDKTTVATVTARSVRGRRIYDEAVREAVS